MAVLMLALAVTAAPGCLALALNRFYADRAVVFDERLIGSWRDADDNVSITIERSEWQSIRVTFEHPVEKGALTGYLFKHGQQTYVDLTPVRGQDLGSFVLPAHALVRVVLGADQLTVAPLRFDWFDGELARKTLPAALRAVKAQREQIVLTAASAALQQWLAGRPATDPAFGPDAVFKRTEPGARRPNVTTLW